MILTKEQILKIMPLSKDKASDFLPWLNITMEEFKINNFNRATMFLAQIAHESGELRRTSEDLYYTADRLMAVWPSVFKTKEMAQGYEKNPERLANFIYANRMGNGDESSGDGWRFRGAGLIQNTGKDTHYECADWFHVERPVVGEWMREDRGATLSAGWFWENKSHLNTVADHGTREAFERVTRRINGGLNGLEDRLHYLERARMALTP